MLTMRADDACLTCVYGIWHGVMPAQAVTWPNTIKLLRTHEPQLVWDDNVAEHAFVYEVRSMA